MDFYQIISVHNRPWSVREIIAFIIVLVIVSAILCCFVKKKKIYPSQAAAAIALFIFLAIVFASTVFTRTPGQAHCEIIPFWSWYEVIVHHDWDLFIQILLNCVMLFPMGVFIPFVLRRRVGKLEAYLYGFTLAFVIEICQLILRRGWFEWDDMIHNGLGCMLGCIFAEWLLSFCKKAKKVFENEKVI